MLDAVEVDFEYHWHVAYMAYIPNWIALCFIICHKCIFGFLIKQGYHLYIYIISYHDLPLIITYCLPLVNTHDDIMCHKSCMINLVFSIYNHTWDMIGYRCNSSHHDDFARQRCGGFYCPPSWCCLLDQFRVASLASFGLMGKWHRHWNHMTSCS